RSGRKCSRRTARKAASTAGEVIACWSTRWSTRVWWRVVGLGFCSAVMRATSVLGDRRGSMVPHWREAAQWADRGSQLEEAEQAEPQDAKERENQEPDHPEHDGCRDGRERQLDQKHGQI